MTSSIQRKGLWENTLGHYGKQLEYERERKKRNIYFFIYFQILIKCDFGIKKEEKNYFQNLELNIR